MAKDDVVIIAPGLEQRVSNSGRKRSVMRVSAEPIAINCDPKALGQGIADALALHYRNEVASISAAAPDATIKAREAAARAVARGESWARKRYAGGRIGAMAPNQTSRAFNDSGRFAKSIVARATKAGNWAINVAANRLQDSTSGGALRIWQRLVQLVPSLRDIGIALRDNNVLKAAVEAAQKSVAKGKPTNRPPNFAAFSQALDFASEALATDDDEQQEETA